MDGCTRQTDGCRGVHPTVVSAPCDCRHEKGSYMMTKGSPVSSLQSMTTRTAPRYGVEMCDQCPSCPWRDDSFFCQLDPNTLKAFDAITFANVYPAETLLFAEGEPPRGLFILCYGSAKLTISSGAGKKLITRRVMPGDALGLTSVLSGNPYKATAETITPSQLKFIKRDDFIRFMGEYRDVSFNIARQLIDECESDADQIRALGLA